MNDFGTTLKALALRQGAKHGNPVLSDLALIPGSEPHVFFGGEGLRDHVEKLLAKPSPGVTGWLLWSEELQILLGDGAPQGAVEGWLLAGEIHVPAAPDAGKLDQTHVIRQKGRDWEVRAQGRAEAHPALAGGLPPAFLQTRELLPWPQLKTLGGRKLRYEVAWRLNASLPTPCYRPAESRFVGFTR